VKSGLATIRTNLQKRNASWRSPMQICESQMQACNRRAKFAKAKNCVVSANADLQNRNAVLQSQSQI